MSEEALPAIDLWVRAGSDGIRNGACPVCHQMFMILLLKADSGQLNFNVKTVNLGKPIAEFKSKGLRTVPAIVIGDEVFAVLDEILETLDARFPEPELRADCPEAEAATKDLFSKFCFFIKDVNKEPRGVENELRKVDQFLAAAKSRFLCGDQITHLDCKILPILHHIRLACGALREYKLPENLLALRAYMRNGYESPVFSKSCPSDQEVILYWANRPDTPKTLSGSQLTQLANQTPTFSLEI